MSIPYITIGGIDIPYTKDEYERHGVKVMTSFVALNGAKKLYYYADDKYRSAPAKYSFVLRTSQIEQAEYIQSLFAWDGAIYMVDYQPIVEAFNDENYETQVFYVSRYPYMDKDFMKAWTDYEDFEIVIGPNPPNEWTLAVAYDWSRKISIGRYLYSSETLYFSYVPFFRVMLREDPLIKWVNNDIQYYEFHLEEV